MSFSSQQKVLDLLREPYFWKIYNTYKENRQSEVWKLFKNYNQRFSKYEKSKWHSEILSLAERYMQETDEWRFLDFFVGWNPNKFLEEDWEEVKKGESVYKPLAIKCLKKAYEIIKTKNNENLDLEWLAGAYEKAISKFPNDNWIKREKALLLIKNGELDSAVEIYKSLVLNLGDKAYIWHEFSSCFNTNIELKIAMLSKAINLERNEDFLGDIHLDLAKSFINKELFENALIELTNYKKHRESKDWKLSVDYNDLTAQISETNTSLTDNKKLYAKYLPLADEFAYQDIPWTKVVLIGIWKNKKNKEKCSFSDGKDINFSISKKRFENLEDAKTGNVFEFKLNTRKKQFSQNVDPFISCHDELIIIENEYIPLLLKPSSKNDWSILEDELAVIDYINKEKSVIHAITTKSEEIFFKDDITKYKSNDFISGKRIKTKIKKVTRVELKNILKIDKNNSIDKFPKFIAIVDHVNQEKELFHFVVNRKIHGIIKFSETTLQLKEGAFLEIWIVCKADEKRNKIIYKAIEIRETDQSSSELMKEINGYLELKYKKDGRTIDFYELEQYEHYGEEISEIEPDFGFIDDYYVSKKILQENKISSNCQVNAKAIFSGDKWKVIELNRLD